MAHDLAASGLRRVNVSLDTLDRERFLQLTRRDELHRTLAGIAAALDAGFSPVRVNAVVMRGVNDDEVADLAAYGRERGVEMRFIEWMPLDGGGGWERDQVVPAEEILDRIAARFPLEEVRAPGTPVGAHAEPAERFRYLDGAGHVGVIASVTRPFCESCDRVRVTAEGQLRTCLFSTEEHDLRAVMRGGGTDDDLAGAIAAAVGTKWAGHAIGQVHFIRPRRSMSQIGG
jgi:GTP 3',8-cyclase